MTSLIHRLEQASEGDLLPCPFCGGEATVSSESCGWRVDCVERNCYTRGPWPDDGTEADAIAAWNTRVDPALKSHTQGQGVE